MNRFALILTTLAFAGSDLPAASNADAEMVLRLQDRIASLETRIMQMETALEKLSPAPKSSAPSSTIPKPEPPSNAPPAQTSQTSQTSQTGSGEEKKVADASKTSTSAEPAKPERKTYLIGEGDTISLIAKKLDVPREELMKTNGLREGQQIFIGDSLRIPEPPAGGFFAKSDTGSKTETSKPSSGADGTVYTVRNGDTLMRIARNHSTTVDAIKSANNLKSDLIGVGQKLKIPGASSGVQTVSDTSSKPDKPNPDRQGDAGIPPNIGELREGETYGLYTVVKGDTLFSLARDFFTSTAEIQRLNKLGESETIRPGQDLVVPTSKYNEAYKDQKQLANR